MNGMIKRIIEMNKNDIEERKKLLPLERKAQDAPIRFIEAFSEFGIIAEIKLKSPTAGKLADKTKISDLAREYKSGGANAISVITEKYFFDGDINFILQTKDEIDLPILQKDFVVDAYQILESKKYGADALLLIAKIITEEELIKFVDLCFKIGLEPVVEISDEEDLDKALKTKTRVIAVNARDLDTFKIDLRNAYSLIGKIPDNYLKLGFSGVNSRNEVLSYKKAGARGVLIGTQLVKSDNKKKFLEDLR